jgi:hypothetical protein
MRVLHCVVAFALVLALAGGASAGKKGKKGKHPVKGVVESVEKSSDKDAGTITVKVTAKKKKGTAPAGAAVEKKIQISEATKIEKVSGKKGQKETKAATLSDVQKGSRVRVTLKAGQDQVAEKIEFKSKGKKKAKKK